MTTNPFINALVASAYVTLVATIIMSIPPKVPLLAVAGPVIFLSLFVFSAAVMGYLFLLQPLLMILRGETQQGIKLFLRTLGFFALVSAVVVATYAIVS